jgi:hypothetical protein
MLSDGMQEFFNDLDVNIENAESILACYILKFPSITNIKQ